MSLELRHLRTLDAIVAEGTFGRAARRLSYTQSTVSQQMAALERCVGGAVFDRPGGPRAVRLTALGEVVLQRGRELLRGADELMNAVERIQAGDGRIDIGTIQSVSTVILPELVGRLTDEYPDCEVRLSEGESEDPRPDEVDLLFFDGEIDDDVESVKILDDPYVLVARPGDFPDDRVPVSHLDGRAMVAWPATCNQPRMERALHAAGVAPRIVFRSASNEALLAMVRFGLGCAVLPRLAVSGAAADPGLRVHTLQPAPAREIYLHRPKGRAPSPVTVRAIEIARQIAADLDPPRPDSGHPVPSTSMPSSNQ